MARKNCYTGKWVLKKAEYRAAYYYAMRYNDLKEELKDLESVLSGVNMDGMPHGSTVGQPTEKIAMQCAEIQEKIELIEALAVEADPGIAKYILKAVTNEGVTFNQLKTLMDIPCEKDFYYDRRRKFYWLLAHKI